MILEDGIMQPSVNKQLLVEDYFPQTHTFPLSNSVLTPAFVNEKVQNTETQAFLRDLSRPHLELIGCIGWHGLHIFDKVHMIWIAWNISKEINSWF